ncbi:MAG: O-methyltransferase [Bacteroidota bacterium]
MKCTNGAIDTYVEQHTEAVPPLLAQIQQETETHVPLPHMLAGHLQGRLLAAVSHMLRPARILEIGTYTGYSALCLAEGLQPGGILHTIDKNDALAPMVRRYFEEAGLASSVQYHLGLAADILPRLAEVFDLVYIDADKRNYRRYYDLVLDRVRPGGFIIADNVLWGGKVLPGAAEPVDKRTQALIDFNRYVHQDTRVAHVLLPIRDGLMIVRKK